MKLKQLPAYLLMVLAIFLVVSQTAARDVFPEQLIGRWVIVGVRVDSAFTGRIYYGYDDRRLVGKTITIGHLEAKGNLPETLSCKGPTIRGRSGQLDDLLGATMPAQDESDQRSSANKYMMPVDGAVQVTAYWVSCEKGDIGPDSPPGPRGQNWIVSLPDGNAAIRWYDNTILILKRK